VTVALAALADLLQLVAVRLASILEPARVERLALSIVPARRVHAVSLRQVATLRARADRRERDRRGRSASDGGESPPGSSEGIHGLSPTARARGRAARRSPFLACDRWRRPRCRPSS